MLLKDGLKGPDDGGHLIFNGSGEQINYVPQKLTQREEIEAMENK